MTDNLGALVAMFTAAAASGGVIATAFLGYLGRRADRVQQAVVDRASLHEKAVSSLASISEGSIKTVLEILVEQNKECEDRSDAQQRRLDLMDERADLRRNRISRLEAALSEAGIPLPAA